MSLSRRELLKRLGAITGAGVVLSSEVLAKMSSTVSASAARDVRPNLQEPKCTEYFSDGDNCGVEGSGPGFVCNPPGYTCTGGPLDDFECYGSGFVCDHGFTCNYSYDGCNISDSTFTGTGGYDDCQPNFYCGNGNFTCTSGHSSS